MSEPNRDELLDAVRRMWTERDPVPEGLVARMQAVAAAADTDLDVELMLLVERSAELAGARGSATAYTLRFEYGELQLLVRVGGDGESRRLDGWVTPSTAMTVRAVGTGDTPRSMWPWSATVAASSCPGWLLAPGPAAAGTRRPRHRADGHPGVRDLSRP